ncbi:hypothetical protein [Pseudonocardia sp. TRM90224]|uniref:hypothetical protein n=1 Tax=Pseudonocardia sp. TRM90224 TaxID=2812678 RepID=UPI001E4A4A92|nr:hypothetical protein [Pseudonocardia sp. TRM90224]
MVLAHGIGGVDGLPLDGELVLQAGGAVVLVSFVAVALLWKQPRFAVTPRPWNEPGWFAVPRAIVLVVTTAVIVVGFVGPQDPDANPAPRALYVLFWVGIVPVSLLFGPVWRALNPLRLLHRVLAAALRLPREGSRSPDGLGHWPAAAGMLAFVWLELVAPAGERPAVVAGFVTGYAVAHTVAASVFGERWFDRADSFEAYSTLTGTLAPLGPGGFRNPFRVLAAVEPAPGLVAFLAVWWGSTVFDGLTGWVGWASVRTPLLDTAVLLLLVALVAGLYVAATRELAGPLATTLVPIAVGYTLAHYFTLLLVEGPRGITQLVGGELGPITAVPAPVLVASVQIGAVLAGHIVAVVAAHDRSVALLPEHRRLADQVPLVLLMVVYTMAGLFLLVIS